MSIEQLIYTSHTTDQFDYADIGKILLKAQQKNVDKDITGALCFLNDYFIQILEGDSDQISALFKIISNDPRHKDIQCIHRADTQQRLFSDWAMRHIEEDEFESLFDSDTDELIFAEFTSKQSLTFFTQIANTMQ